MDSYDDGYLSYFTTLDNKVLMIYLNKTLHVNCSNDLDCPTNAVCFKNPTWSNFSSICACSIDWPVSGMNCNERFLTPVIAAGVIFNIMYLIVACISLLIVSVTLLMWAVVAKDTIDSYKRIGSLDVTLFLVFFACLSSVLWPVLTLLPLTNTIEGDTKKQQSSTTLNALWVFFVLTLFFNATSCFNIILVWLRLVLTVNVRMRSERYSLKKSIITLSESRIRILENVLKVTYAALVIVMLYFAITQQFNSLAAIGVALFVVLSILFAIVHFTFLQGFQNAFLLIEKHQMLSRQVKYVSYTSICMLATLFYVDSLLVAYFIVGGYNHRTPNNLISYPIAQAVYFGLALANFWVVLYLCLVVRSTFEKVKINDEAADKKKQHSFFHTSNNTDRENVEFTLRRIPTPSSRNNKKIIVDNNE